MKSDLWSKYASYVKICVQAVGLGLCCITECLNVKVTVCNVSHSSDVRISQVLKPSGPAGKHGEPGDVRRLVPGFGSIGTKWHFGSIVDNGTLDPVSYFGSIKLSLRLKVFHRSVAHRRPIQPGPRPWRPITIVPNPLKRRSPGRVGGSRRQAGWFGFKYPSWNDRGTRDEQRPGPPARGPAARGRIACRGAPESTVTQATAAPWPNNQSGPYRTAACHWHGGGLTEPGSP